MTLNPSFMPASPTVATLTKLLTQQNKQTLLKYSLSLTWWTTLRAISPEPLFDLLTQTDRQTDGHVDNTTSNESLCV